MILRNKKLGDSGRTDVQAFFSRPIAEIQLLDSVVPVGATLVQIVGFDPLVDRCLVVHTGDFRGADPGDGVPHHHILQVLVEEVHLVVMHQGAALVKSILEADLDRQRIRAGVDREVLPILELATSKEVVEEEPEVVFLIQLVGQRVEIPKVGFEVRLDGDRDLIGSIHRELFVSIISEKYRFETKCFLNDTESFFVLKSNRQ
jgi:hypothetical protein